MKHILVTWFCLVALCLSMIVPESWQSLAFGVSLACMGPLAVGCDLLTIKPDKQWQHSGVVLLRAFAFVAVGAVLHWNPSPTRSPLFFWIMALLTQIMVLALLPEKSDRDDHAPLRDGMAYVSPISFLFNAQLVLSWWRMDRASFAHHDTSFSSLGWFSSSPHLSLEMALGSALMYGVWKSLLWYNLSAKPFSQGQHRSYWTRLRQSSGPTRLWAEVRQYLSGADPSCSPAMLDHMVANVPFDALRAYFIVQPKSHRDDVQAAYDRLTHAVQKRIAQLDPRTVPVFALYGNDWPSLLGMFERLDDAPAETYALPI